jgi:sugar fermentation stimulation protein A
MTAKLLHGDTVTAHVADPGRLEELLYKGNIVLIVPATESSHRKTGWSLVAAQDSTGWVLVNTGYHRQIATSLFLGQYSPVHCNGVFRAEVKSPSGNSRFDFLLNGTTWVEVKGCTLKKGRKALFPDAPTSRGLKHVKELTQMACNGVSTAIVILIFVRETDSFLPNVETDPEFAEALYKAISTGVKVHAVQTGFDGKHVEYTGQLPVICNY